MSMQSDQSKLVNKPTDGTQSDSALSNPVANSVAASTAELAGVGIGGSGTGGKQPKRRPSMAKALVILGLSKKSNSASNLTMGKRFGFARSEEYGVMPELRNRNLSPPSNSGDSAGNDDKNRPKSVSF